MADPKARDTMPTSSLQRLLQQFAWLLLILSISYFLIRGLILFSEHSLGHLLRRIIPPQMQPDAFAAVLLAITGIWYAVQQGADSRSLDDSLKDQVVKLRDIVEALSTKSLPVFPDHVQDVAKLAGDSDVIYILINCVDYGSFFSPSEHQKVHAALINLAKQRNDSLRILICENVPTALNMASSNISKSQKDYDDHIPAYLKSLRSDGFKDFLYSLDVRVSEGSGTVFFSHFIKAWLNDCPVGFTQDEGLWREALRTCWDAIRDENGTIETVTMSRDNITISPAFALLLQLRQYYFLYDLLSSGADIRHCNTTALYFWLRLKRTKANVGGVYPTSAIFTFADGSDPPAQVSFWTSDGRLAESFGKIFVTRWGSEKSGPTPTWMSMAYEDDSKVLFGASRQM